MTMAQCILCGLDLLGSLDIVTSEHQLLIHWIYSQQQHSITTAGELSQCIDIAEWTRQRTLSL